MDLNEIEYVFHLQTTLNQGLKQQNKDKLIYKVNRIKLETRINVQLIYQEVKLAKIHG